MISLSIRRAEPNDAPGILDCLIAAFEPYRDSYTPEAFHDTVMSPETIGRRLTEMSVLVAVAESGEIAGTIGYTIIDGREGHIRGMAVRPACLGTGVGQDLLEAAETALRREGCDVMTLDTTEPLERAIRFYQRNGFCFSGTVRDFYGMRLLELTKPLM